jgi:hypothetical protein
MRATLGRIAVVALLSIALCGCKGGPSMFAGKKKDNLDEAPKYASSPTLPSAGQSPGSAPTNVNGTVAAGMPSFSSVDNPTVNSSYGSQPAGYQQSPYPTTPYPPATIGQANANTTTGLTNTPAATPSWAGGGTNSVASSGPTAYNNTAAVQPQQGQYDTSYAGNGSPAAPSYAAAPTASAYGNGAAAAAPPPASAAIAAAPDYRTADARSAQSAGAYSATSPAAPPASGDRYGNLAEPSYGGGANANPPSGTAGAPAAAPMNTPAPPATNNDNDRYSMPPSNPPASVPTSSAPPSVYGPTADFATPPAVTNGGPAAAPARPDPVWRPGNTSSVTPRLNSPRPGAGENLPGSSTPGQVIPASYETAAQAPMTPPSSASFAAPPAVAPSNTSETYGTYQGSAPPAQTSNGNPPAGQPGQFSGHAF